MYIPESQKSVFDRLKSAIAASESIPAIIAEIDALLPEGYFVSKTLTDIQETIVAPLEPAEDMSDWRNWREGDVLVIVSNECGHGFEIGSLVKFEEKTYDNSCCLCTSSYESWYVAPQEARFHARPAKATE